MHKNIHHNKDQIARILFFFGGGGGDRHLFSYSLVHVSF